MGRSAPRVRSKASYIVVFVPQGDDNVLKHGCDWSIFVSHPVVDLKRGEPTMDMGRPITPWRRRSRLRRLVRWPDHFGDVFRGNPNEPRPWVLISRLITTSSA